MIRERDRLQALRRYRLLDTEAHPAFDRVTKATAAALKAPIALISLVDDERQWFKSFIGLSVQETPRCYSFCSHAIEGSDVFVVEDASQDSRFASNPLVTGEPFIRFYAGAPLIDDEGFALGTLCVIAPERRTLSHDEQVILESLAACAMTAIALHQQSLTLARAERLLKNHSLSGAKSRVH